MGKKKYAIPLILAFVFSAFAIPYFTGAFDEEIGDEGEAASTDETASGDAFEGASSADETDAASGDGSPTEQAIIDDLVAASDPKSPTSDSIRSRLAPLTSAANGSVEPYPTPAPTTLYQATLSHPAHTQQDLRYVQSLQPLPEDLDKALARVVLAHGVSTQMLSQSNPSPGASLTASVTMATALDTAMPTLERYVGHPVWDDRSPADERDVSPSEIDAPPLDEALLDLYSALGYDAATIDALATPAAEAAAELGTEESQALARLVTAQANVQRASASSMLFLAAPTAHGPVDEASRQVDGELSGTPLEQLTVATEQLRAAAQAAHETIEQAPTDGGPADEPVRQEPWVDPLGLVVVGTRGSDTYDASHGGETTVLDTAVTEVDDVRAAVGETSANTSDAGPASSVDEGSEQSTYGSGSVDADNRSTDPKPGWHMLVLDPGGNDTYRNNAGGIDAGSVIVRADVDTRGAVPGVKSQILRGDRACTPVIALCEPTLPGGIQVGQFLRAIQAEGPSASQGPIPIGLPLTAATVDAGGDDDYEDTGPVIQGAARGLGVGILYDAEGNDTYEASTVAQGAGEQYGLGVLADGAGNDTYEASHHAQGWVDMPNPNATFPFGVGFITDARAQLELARFTQGSLLDAGGHDDYRLEDDVAGQGIVQIPEGFLRKSGLFRLGYQAERATAQLVDVGGTEQLPVPSVRFQGQTHEMPPSQVNVSGEQTADLWLTRRVPEPPSSTSFFHEETTRFKTALHTAAAEAVPDPLGENTLRAGSVEVDCREGFRDNVYEAIACSFGDQRTPPLLLFGEPSRVDNPPALTLTFGGDTHYNGSIAAATAEGGGTDDGYDIRFLGVQAKTAGARLVTDLAGNDTYEGRNNTIASIEGMGGSALVVDRQGADEMHAGNRSIAYADTPLGYGSGAVSAVLDLDGNLNATSDERSQAFASKISTRPVSTSNDFPRGTAVPPMALLDAGAEAEDAEPSSEEPVGEDEIRETVPSPAGLDLQAGNASQGFSEGLGVAVVVGSAGEDRYSVDGWGQGVHDEQQIAARFCEPPEASNGRTAQNQLRATNPWVGGIGLVVDADGDDDYHVDSGVGAGDAVMRTSNCPGSRASIGPYNVNVLGLGSLLDVRGQDDYTVTDTPTRPDRFPPRSCSGTNRTECQPNDDRAWMAIDEEHTAGNPFFGHYRASGTIGLGIDNVRNAHHAGMAACRNLDAFKPERTSKQTVGPGIERQGDRVGQNTTWADDAAFLECDEALNGLWDAYLGDVVESTIVPFNRAPQLELALPRDDAQLGVGGSQSTDRLDETGADRAPIPAEVTVPERPEPLFLGDVAEPQCEDRKAASEVSTRGRPDTACLSITRDIDMGQWFTNNPAADRLDPGDTIGCNCSVRLQIDAAQASGRINLRALEDQGLYPDRGRATTFTTETQTWYDAHNRFRVPLTVEQPIQDGRLRGDFAQTEAAADFPLNLSRLPTGLARVEVTAIVEDQASEETGGMVPEAVSQWRPTLVHERSFEQAYVADTDDGAMVFLSAPGPVDPDEKPTIQIDEVDADLREALADEEWRATSATTFEHDLPETTVIDAPRRSPVGPQAGAPACAAMILDRHRGDGGSCWTGDSLVVGLPLGDADPAQADVGVEDRDLPETNLSIGDSDAEPKIGFSSQETYRIDASRGDVAGQPDLGRLEVHGVPGTEVLPAGKDLAETLLGEDTDENWALITVEASQDRAIGLSPMNPCTAEAAAASSDCSEQRINLTNNHDHENVHRVLGATEGDHSHVELWTPPSNKNDGSVALGEEILYEDTERHVLPCANLNYADLEEVTDVLSKEEDYPDDADPEQRLRDRTCVSYSHDGELHYLLPLDEFSGTQLVRLKAHLLQADGETETKEITGHIDPVGAQGQVFVKPAAAQTPETDVRLQMFPQTAEIPRLTDEPSRQGAGSDLVSVDLEARPAGGNWTSLDDPWGEMPTPRRPSVDAHVDLSSFTEEDANTSTVELRGVFQDESNNTIRTNAREFILDRAPPNVTNARVVSGAGENRLVLTVDEAVAEVQCATEGCPLDATEPLPGAEPEPFLDRTRMEIGPRTITIPILDLKRGPTYEVGLELTDTLGNTVLRNLTLETFTQLTVDASPMENTLVNKTVTLNWTTETRDRQTLSTFSSAYLLLPNGACPVLKANPGVVPADGVQTVEKGPLSVRGEAGETACEVPDEGADATLLVYAIAPNVDAIALDRVPVHVDTTSPTVSIDGPGGWVNETATVAATSNDSLATEIELYVDGEAQGVDGASGQATVVEEGVHEVLARATDEAGNVAVNATMVRIDRTSPSVSAEVLGVRGGLALVNATATDQPSGVRDVQLSTRSTSGPTVPGVDGRSVLLSVPVEPDEDELALRTRDKANNTRDLRLSIEDVPRVESGPLVTGLELSTPAPDTLRASFQTTNETTPVVLLDVGDRHVQQALEPGRDHELTVDELPPGHQAQLTITIPRGTNLVPALNATTAMPEDDQPPTKLRDVQAKPVEGGVKLTWQPADDDVGVAEVVVQRDGTEVARTSANLYTDEPKTFEAHTYKLAAVDRAGNRGPWTEVEARPVASFSITDISTEPEALSPDQPVTVQATVQTPAGLSPDVVTVSVGDQQLPMRPVEEGPYRSTYEVQTRLPTLDVAAEETAMVVNATAGDRTESERFPAPVVATIGPAGGADPDEVPAPGIIMAISTIALVAVTRRRWLL